MIKTKITVSVSDARVSNDPQNILTTYSLGSCIGVSIYDPIVKIGGLLHYQLPDSKIDDDKAKHNPFMFADTGMQVLLDHLITMGVIAKRLRINIAGGANMQTGPKGFDIGKRNHLAIRKLLWQRGIFIEKEDVGGTYPRNMYLDVSDGTVTIRSNGNDKQL